MSHSPETVDRVQLGQVIFSETQIQNRVKELAAQISRDYEGQSVHLLAVLRRAVPGSCTEHGSQFCFSGAEGLL